MTTETWPPVFTLDTERVLKLFTGDRFYSSADASIREAVLNAIDACNRSQGTAQAAPPEIAVLFDDDANTVTISDNGIGMDRQELIELFSKVGASASTMAEKTSEGQVKTIGEFGIGVVSYFLACDRFQVQTFRAGSEASGLEFSTQMLDGKTAAKLLRPSQETVGTTVTLLARDKNTYELLLGKFPRWMRAVEGLRAKRNPGGEEIKQGGLSKEIRLVKVSSPEWVEKAELGPPVVFDVWDHLDGRGHVDVLYRGVYVDRVDAKGLWGIEGAIHVDPKHFKPKLNREGFVGQELQQEVTRFLQQVHPEALRVAIDCVREVLSGEHVKDWALLKLVTLWLAVPRTGPYAGAAKEWDDEFRQRKTFRLLEDGEAQREVSVAELQTLSPDRIYIAPPRLDRAQAVVQQAVRVLRARGSCVVQGIQRDTGYLTYASFPVQSTAELLMGHFRRELPPLEQVEAVAEKVVSEEAVAEIYEETPRVRIVHLGVQGAPLVKVKDEIWLNVDSQSGKRIIQEICALNDGYLGLWIACLKHAPNHVGEIVNLLHREPTTTLLLGLVKRQYLRGLTK